METRKRSKFLGIDDYDDSGNIKTGFFLQFSLVYFARFLLYGPVSLLAGLGLRYDLSFLTDLPPGLMITSIPPTILLFFLLAGRSLIKSRMVEVFFNNGKLILIGVGILQLILLVYGNFSVQNLSNVFLIGLFFNFLMVFLVWKSERIELVFKSNTK